MCRNIKQLRGADPPVTDEEIALAALQYVRKVSGYRKPSQTNQAVFDAAVADIAAATKSLLVGLVVRPAAASSRPDRSAEDLSGLH